MEEVPGTTTTTPSAASAAAETATLDVMEPAAVDEPVAVADAAARPFSLDNARQQYAAAGRGGGGGRLSVRSMNFGIPTNQGTQHHVHETHGSDSWRYRVLKVLHSTKLQGLLMVMLLLDVAIIFMEIFLLAEYPTCHTVRRDAISCCSSPAGEGEETHGDSAHDGRGRFLAASSSDVHHEEQDGGHGHNVCESGGVEGNYEAGCDEHKWHRVHTAEEVLFCLTMIILSILFLELNITMVALKPTIFFRQFFFLLDYFIVSVSFALELTFRFLDEDALQSLAGLLILGRLWRFLRIEHGIVEVTAELAHRDFEHLLAYTEQLETILAQNGLAVPDSDHIRSIKHEHHVSGDLIFEIEREHRAMHARKLLSSSSSPAESGDDDDDDDRNNS